MVRFTMCAACQAEYDDPRDRRFHAQPNACWECGPRLALSDAEGVTSGERDPMEATLALLRAGKIVAVKGIGGFHLVVDATIQEAVARLRGRKHRFGKPLEVMVRDMDAVRRLCVVNAAAEGLLTSTEMPIVLLRALSSNGLAAEIAPGVPWLGVFLPYAPVHHLLVGEGGLSALVMTSANLSEEPIAIANEEAVERLHGIADALLMHDREILQRGDDSVMCVIEGAPQFLRRSRGHEPQPVRLPMEVPPLMAVGYHLMSVFTLVTGHHANQSQHLCDLESVSSLDFFLPTRWNNSNVSFRSSRSMWCMICIRVMRRRRGRCSSRRRRLRCSIIMRTLQGAWRSTR